jgi:hypothetical protein
MALGSGIRKKPIPDPGSRGQKKRHRIPDPGSGSATLKKIIFVGIESFGRKSMIRIQSLSVIQCPDPGVRFLFKRCV